MAILQSQAQTWSTGHTPTRWPTQPHTFGRRRESPPADVRLREVEPVEASPLTCAKTPAPTLSVVARVARVVTTSTDGQTTTTLRLRTAVRPMGIPGERRVQLLLSCLHRTSAISLTCCWPRRRQWRTTAGRHPRRLHPSAGIPSQTSGGVWKRPLYGLSMEHGVRDHTRSAARTQSGQLQHRSRPLLPRRQRDCSYPLGQGSTLYETTVSRAPQG